MANIDLEKESHLCDGCRKKVGNQNLWCCEDCGDSFCDNCLDTCHVCEKSLCSNCLDKVIVTSKSDPSRRDYLGICRDCKKKAEPEQEYVPDPVRNGHDLLQILYNEITSLYRNHRELESGVLGNTSSEMKAIASMKNRLNNMRKLLIERERHIR